MNAIHPQALRQSPATAAHRHALSPFSTLLDRPPLYQSQHFQESLSGISEMLLTLKGKQHMKIISNTSVKFYLKIINVFF